MTAPPTSPTPAAASRPRSVLITGCSKGGIGDALAQEFHRRGCRVFATARDPAKAAHLVDVGISAADILTVDVEVASSIAAAAEAVRSATGGVLDVLVNNAGIGYGATMLDSEISAGRRLFDVHVWGALACTQAFAPLLMASGDGRVVNIGSHFAYLTPAFAGLYSAAKAALGAMTETMRVELAPFNVHVVLVVGGIITTNVCASMTHHMPETSVYAPMRKQVEAEIVHSKTLNRHMSSKRASRHRFAQEVVADALARRPKAVVWRGYLAFLAWLTVMFVPLWVRDYTTKLYIGFAGWKPLAKTA